MNLHVIETARRIFKAEGLFAEAKDGLDRARYLRTSPCPGTALTKFGLTTDQIWSTI